MTLTPSQESYMIIPDNMIPKNYKYEYDIESNVLKLSKEKKIKRREIDELRYIKKNYRCLLFINVILTIQFLVFIVFCVRNYESLKQQNIIQKIRRERRLNNTHRQSFRSDFNNPHKTEVTNLKKYAKLYSNKNIDLLGLLKPVYTNSLLSKRIKIIQKEI